MFSWLFRKRGIDKELKELLENGININVNVNIIGDINAQERRNTVAQENEFTSPPPGDKSTGYVGGEENTSTGIQDIEAVPDFGKLKTPKVKFGDEQ
jgi:hypothetical protein